jgi:hypothetical protein
MNEYVNAAPTHGAIFDNAPAQPAEPFPAVTMTTTTEYLTPATRIAQGRNGKWYGLDVLMQYGRPVPLALALSRVQMGRTVFVQPGDAQAVLDAARGGGNGETQQR